MAFFGIITIYAQTAVSNQLIGIWTADVEYNRSFDSYRINLNADGRCTVKVSNNSAEQETAGNWSYDSSLFRLNATFRNAKISYLSNIQWSSVINFATDNNSFNIPGRNATNGTQTRISFFKSDDRYDITYNDRAIARVFDDFSKDIPVRSRLAIVGIAGADSDEATFYFNELTIQFVNSRKYTVVDRSDIDKVLTEHNF
jgi:hypothetical protein